MNNDINIILSNKEIKSRASFYFLSKIDFNAGELTFLIESFEDHAIKIIFKDYYSFRIIEESIMLNYFNDRNLKHIEGNRIYIMENTSYMNELKNVSQNFSTQNNKNPKLYGIYYLCDDFIEVISASEPDIEYNIPPVN